jgi:ABC-type bacteriocin/lantibiotic exporter with double-glycine peptidase domain
MGAQSLRHGIQVVFLACMWMVSGGCSSTSSSHASAGAPGANEWYISGVPFYPQLAYQCGPASLAAVLNYWGDQVTPDEIARAIYSPRLKGTLSLDMWQYARAQQFQADMRRGSLEDLKAHVHANIPVIAFLNLGYEWLPGGHFVVVVGLDPDKGFVITYSGKEQDSRISYDRFLKAWQKTNFWTLVVRPKTDT